MNVHLQEEHDAWFSRADRFDGFDRGDTDFIRFDPDADCAFPELEAAYEAMLRGEQR